MAFGTVLGLAGLRSREAVKRRPRRLDVLEARLNEIEDKMEALRRRHWQRTGASPGRVTEDAAGRSAEGSGRRAEESGRSAEDSGRRATLDDLHTAGASLRDSILRDVDNRLEVHERSVETLRQVVENTDTMLERVLEILEASGPLQKPPAEVER